MNWSGKRVLVTGGASFIGSHLVDQLVERGADHIRIVDDLSSGEIENIQGHLDSHRVKFINEDLLDQDVAAESVKGIDTVFHLAAIHGGRGYVDMHQAECAKNLTLDGMLIKAAQEAGVDKFVFASSGCVYPNYVQQDVTQELYLTEDMVGPPYDSDGMYGWAKLMGEKTLQAFNWVKWTVVLLLAGLILVTIAMVHSDNRSTAAIAMALFAIGVAACVVLIASHNRPFTGEISVGPDLLMQVMPKE